MATRDGGTQKPPAPKPPAADRRWHAVSVKPGSRACPAAVSGKNRRWLSRQAPMMPLPGCTQPDACQCTYQHHADRRGGGRRADEIDAFRPPMRVNQERRARRDRRAPREE